MRRLSTGRRVQLAFAAVLVVAGVASAIGAVATAGSVRSHLAGTYALVSQEGRSAVYSSPQPPVAVARAIARRWRPSEQVNDPGGYFLRYRNDVVAVTPAGEGGSRIYVDDQRRGYARWYPYVGGRWGTFSGRGETVRGGGPGTGK